MGRRVGYSVSHEQMRVLTNMAEAAGGPFANGPRIEALRGFYGMSVVESLCITLVAPDALVGGKSFEIPALAALTCPVHS